MRQTLLLNSRSHKKIFLGQKKIEFTINDPSDLDLGSCPLNVKHFLSECMNNDDLFCFMETVGVRFGRPVNLTNKWEK